MTLELNLSPEVEARLRADAQSRRVPIEAVAEQAIANTYQELIPKESEAAQKRREAAAAGFGMFAGVGDTVNEFMAKRSAEEGEGEAPQLPKGQRRAAIEAGFGSMRGLLSSDRFLEERHEEAARELEKSANTQWLQVQKQAGQHEEIAL